MAVESTNWVSRQLGDLIQIKHGYAFKGKYFGDAGTHVVLTPGNFYEGGGFRVKGDKEKWYSGPVPPDYVLETDDLIVAMTEQAEGLLGSSALVPESNKYLHNQRLGLVAVKLASETDRKFLYYLFNSRSVREQIRASANGAKIRHTSPARIYEVEVRVPNADTQRHIASILSAYDELIENNTRRIAILEEMARRIYEEWFIRFRFPGYENVRIVESELGPVPEGWSHVSLGTLADVNARSIKRGKEPKEISYVDISSVSTASIDEQERMQFVDAPGRARRIVQHGDVIWACVRPNRKSYAAIIDPHPSLIVSTGFAVLSATTVPWSYLYQAVTTEDFVGYLVNRAKGAAYPAVSAEDFESANILRPDPTTLQLFDANVEPMMRLNATLARKNTNLRATRDLLLPKLISGELDVSSLPEPEVAVA